MRRTRRGASAVEFALTLPLLVGLVGLTVEWGWLMTQQTWIHAAARDSARWAVEQDPNTTAVAVASTSAAEEWLDLYNFDCASGGCDVQTHLVDVAGRIALRVTIDIDYAPIFGIIPVPAQLHGESTYLLKYQDPIVDEGA